MSIAVSAESARATRRRAESNGVPFWHTTILGANRYRSAGEAPPEAGQLYPMAFLVEQDPKTTVQAHFHQADQFQVIVGGSGRLGTHAVAPVSVHFSGAFSAYGPIRADDHGIAYLTLRNGWDPGARYMPGARGELPRPRRHREVSVGPLAPLGEHGAELVIGVQADGLGSWHWHVRGGEMLVGPNPAEGGGQFWVVLTGSLTGDGASLGPGSCLFVAPHEDPLAVVAGEHGAAVLGMQFPRLAGLDS